MDNAAYSQSIKADNVNCNSVSNSHSIIDNVNSINKVIADENPEIMQWLSPLDPNGRHQHVRANRLDGVGNWFLETNEIRAWRSSEGRADKSVLFCYGNPGVGKTYLSSLVIDSIRDEPCERGAAIAMFYCDFRDQKQQTVTNIMGAILKQLVAREEVLGSMKMAFQIAEGGVGGRGPLLSEIVRFMKLVIATLPWVFICIDALDECLPKHRLKLLESLKGILLESPRTRILVTGRPQVKAQITEYFTTTVTIPISLKMQDIKIYLERKLEMDTKPDAMPDSLRADILRVIPERTPEIFLFVTLNTDAILAEVTVGERKQKFKELSNGNHVEHAYTTALARINAQKGSRSRLGMQALMWVSNSEQPLHTRELCHALGVKIGSSDPDVKNIPTIQTLLGCSLGLITVEASSDTVQLVHPTLQEYLSNNPGLFQGPHSTIAEVCLTYLNFQSVRDLSPTLRSTHPTLPLVEYASWFWGKHMRKEQTERVSPLVLGLLIRFEQHISSQLLLLRYYKERGSRKLCSHKDSRPNKFTGLHAAAFLGMSEAVAILLAVKEWDLNAKDASGRTALLWAAVGGHEDVVKILLQRKDVNPNTPGTKCGGTPLWWAAKGGHEGIVKLLLDRGGVDPSAADTNYGRTPFWWAAKGGHEGIVKLLLERGDINPNTADTHYGRTPVWWAAKGGHEGIVELLLEREDIDPNNTDTQHDRTPLLLAAMSGHEGVVELLLEREDISPNTVDTYGRTPLLWAAKGGHKGVVNLLLEREDINPGTADTKYGQTPLSWAAEGGQEGVVKLLLERKDINPNTADTKFGRTPLSWAAEGGHERVVRLLLERDDVNSHTPDFSGQTALELAESFGHTRIVELLSEPEPSFPIPADHGQVPEHPSPEPSNLPQSPHQPSPSPNSPP